MKYSFYDVGLVCEAAPGIACAIRSKPILNALESHVLVSRAWLNRTGTKLAVEWTDAANDEEQQRIICAALGTDTTAASRIADPATLLAASEEFADGSSWYRPETLDELSREEGWVIAERLVRRMLATKTLDATRQDAIRGVIANASGNALATSAPGTVATREKLLADAILNAACRALDESEIKALRQAFSSGGHRPMAGEA